MLRYLNTDSDASIFLNKLENESRVTSSLQQNHHFVAKQQVQLWASSYHFSKKEIQFPYSSFRGGETSNMIRLRMKTMMMVGMIVEILT